MLAAPAVVANTPSPAMRLLDWYDRHGRDLPWRVKGGAYADPYRVWLSEIMLQQTTVEAVKPYFQRFLTLWPNVQALAEAEDVALMSSWAGLGYYARARNLLSCARRVMSEHGGEFPADESMLRTLPGIGAYTAAAIASIAFARPALVIDGNVERIISRLRRIATPLPQAKPEISSALAELAPVDRPGDFAQAMMDLGATICTPRNPACTICPWLADCAGAKAGDAGAFPVKLPRKPKPVRHGIAYLAVDVEGRILLGTRPPKGLLGGMSEVPGTDWIAGDAFTGLPRPPLCGDWQRLNQPVVHVFTHFELRLSVEIAHFPTTPAPQGLRWVPRNALANEALPTLMRKVLAAGRVE